MSCFRTAHSSHSLLYCFYCCIYHNFNLSVYMSAEDSEGKRSYLSVSVFISWTCMGHQLCVRAVTCFRKFVLRTRPQSARQSYKGPHAWSPSLGFWSTGGGLAWRLLFFFKALLVLLVFLQGWEIERWSFPDWLVLFPLLLLFFIFFPHSW